MLAGGSRVVAWENWTLVVNKMNMDKMKAHILVVIVCIIRGCLSRRMSPRVGIIWNNNNGLKTSRVEG